jgi:hypothetical protein
VVLAVVGIAMLAGIAAPVLLRMKKKGDQLKFMSIGKDLAIGLNNFSAEYGGLPDRETAKAVTARTGSSLNLSGDTANDYFRQLIAAGIARSEDPFWAKTPYSPKPPDNNMTGDEALKAGEVGFGYIIDGFQSPGDAKHDRIIAVTPLLNANGEFDPGPMNGNAVLVCLDSSVRFMTIRPDRKVEIGNGKTLLETETGADNLWGSGIPPVIKMPKKR